MIANHRGRLDCLVKQIFEFLKISPLFFLHEYFEHEYKRLKPVLHFMETQKVLMHDYAEFSIK